MSEKRSRWLLCLVVCVLCSGSVVLSQSQEEGEGDDDHGLVERIQAAFNESGVDPNEILTHPELETYGTNFDCPVILGRPAATNVHKLTPYDIKVVAAMGDSVMAGFGADARTIFGAFTEYRGVSWSIGGDKDVSSLTTLPNIIKKYNPSVKGFSIKTGGSSSSNARLNVAVSGAIAQDMPGQARRLVDKIRADSSIDFNNDWKLVTIWIGGNDLCDICNGGAEHTPENYVGYIGEAIEYLHAELPRTFVNVVKILDVTEIADLGGFFDVVCNLVHLFACNCAKNARQYTHDAFEEYNRLLEGMEKYFQDDSDDFAVVLQPFMQGVTLPQNNPKSYFAPDCFHFSTKAHEIAATALWNNMIEPVGEKDEKLDFEHEKEINCPNEDAPYFFTHKNSPSQTFGIESNDPTSNDSGSSNILAILLGTGIALYVIGMVTLLTITVVGVRWMRKKRGLRSYDVTADSEKITLVKK